MPAFQPADLAVRAFRPACLVMWALKLAKLMERVLPLSLMGCGRAGWKARSTMEKTTMRRRLFHPRAALLLPLCALALAGCDRGSFGLDMYDQPRKEPYEKSEFHADGQSARPLVPGTVARDSSLPGFPDRNSTLVPVAGLGHVAATDGFPADFPREGDALAATLSRGQKLFNIQCSMCHGLGGQGDGMIVQRGFTPPPSFVLLERDRESNPYRYQREQFLQTVAPGHVYGAITNGFGAMYSYADRVAPQDRWAIAAYVKLLQQTKPEMASTSQPAGEAGGGVHGPAAEKRQP